MEVIQRFHSQNDPVDHPVVCMGLLKCNELVHTYSHIHNLPTTGLIFTVYGHGAGLTWLISYLQKQ